MLYTNKPKEKKTLKDNPLPITNTPATRQLEKTDMEVEVSPRNNTEALTELHPLIKAQTTVEKAKKKEKQDKIKEIKEKGEYKINKDEEVNDMASSKEKHIKLLGSGSSYDVGEDLRTLKANISVAQLLDISPKVKAELNRQLKFNKENQVNLVHKGKIAISKCRVYDVPSKVYLDYGSGINLISKSYLEKLPMKPEPIGLATSSIVQVLSDIDETPGLLYRLPLTIGNITFEANFRLIEKNNVLFDIIISYETSIENYLFINPVTFELCKINSSMEIQELKELFEEINNKYNL